MHSKNSDPLYFSTFEAFYAWLEHHHAKESEQWIGFYKKSSGIRSISWPESVDAALCFGWIDGVRKSIDEKRYMIRFTPRKPGSHWSLRNIDRFEAMEKAGRMRKPGSHAFEKRTGKNTGRASYEVQSVGLSAEFLKILKGHEKAWKFFRKTIPSYQRACTHWIMSAKQEKTRRRRLDTLIRCSAHEEPVPPMKWGKNPTGTKT